MPLRRRIHAGGRIIDVERRIAVQRCEMAERGQIAARQGRVRAVLRVQRDFGVARMDGVKRRADGGDETALLGRNLFVGGGQPQRHLAVRPAVRVQRFARLLPAPRLVEQDAYVARPPQPRAQRVVTKKLLKAFDIDNEVYYADLNWKELMKAIRSVKISYKEISKFPAVKRDLALLLDKNVQFAEIEKIAYDTEKKLLKEVELFDVYEGKNLEPGKKSYAVSFLLQDESQTLNDKMIDKIMSKLVKNLEDKLGAKLR